MSCEACGALVDELKKIIIIKMHPGQVSNTLIITCCVIYTFQNTKNIFSSLKIILHLKNS
jgi:predicted transcriptional regulator